MPPQLKLAYAPSERVLCFHGPLMYEAKILKAEHWTEKSNAKGEPGPHYFVHYKGWKTTWDEWVAEDRLLKFNDENVARQKQLNDAQRAKDRAEREASSGAAKLAANKKDGAPRGTKRARDTAGEEEDFVKKPEIKLPIPDVLKILLVDDWEAVTKNSQLVPLPREPSVQTILKMFEEQATTSERPSRSASLTHEVVQGLQLYFDKAIGNNLLYRFERQQYGEMKKKQPEGTEMSAVYGAEHLLRLFVNLPELIAHTSMDAETVTVLREALSEFLKWMVKEQKTLFNVKHVETTTAYQNLSTV